jgi:hypothetical protein
MGVDLTPEAVEQLHPFRALVRQVDPVQGNGTWDEEFMAVRYDDVEPIVRALSARVVELKAERDEAIGANILNRNAVRMQQVKRHASERALATARADALREAAKWCNDEAERCDDASRWGGSRKYVADCKAAAYALHNARHKIEALIPQEKPHE